MARQGASGLELLVEAMGGDFTKADEWLRAEVLRRVQVAKAPVYGPSAGDLDGAEEVPAQVFFDEADEGDFFSQERVLADMVAVESISDDLCGIGDKIQGYLDEQPDSSFRHSLERVTFAELYSDLDAQPSRFALKYGGQPSEMRDTAARNAAIRDRHLAETLPGALEARATAAIVRERAEKVAAATLAEEGVIGGAVSIIESFPNATVAGQFGAMGQPLLGVGEALAQYPARAASGVPRWSEPRKDSNGLVLRDLVHADGAYLGTLAVPDAINDGVFPVAEGALRLMYSATAAKGPSVFDAEIHRALAEIRETVKDRSSRNAPFGYMDGSAGISTSLRTLRALARIGEPSSDSRRV